MTAKKKPATKKKAAPKKEKVEMLSYSIKMVIPTVEFGNIQPEIIVKAGSVEAAHDFIIPHMNKLWKEYYLVDGKRPKAPTPTPVVKPIPAVETLIVTTPTPAYETVSTTEPNVKIVSDSSNPSLITSEQIDNPPVSTPPPPSSVALVKATQAIESCMSLEALQLIINQVKISVKLTEEDKKILEPLLANKEIELNAGK